jgi:hypothetical protein
VIRKRLALRLAHIENVNDAEAKDLLRFVLRGAVRNLPLLQEHRSEDRNALLALLHGAAQLLPGVEAGHAGGVGLLARDEKDISEAVAVELGHGGEVLREDLALPRLQPLCELIERGVCDFAGVFGFHDASPGFGRAHPVEDARDGPAGSRRRERRRSRREPVAPRREHGA